jgi:hypothetical protein
VKIFCVDRSDVATFFEAFFSDRNKGKFGKKLLKNLEKSYVKIGKKLRKNWKKVR